MIYCFGDSWGYGSELDFDAGEKPFVELFGEPFKNFSCEGLGFPLIATTIIEKQTLIKSDDTVLVVIPPDTRWYTQSGKGFTPFVIHNGEKTKEEPNKKYMDFVSDKDSYWFVYHSNWFLYTIQSILDGIGCRYMFMHNYGGKYLITREFQKLIKIDKFLNREKSLTDILSDSEDSYKNWVADLHGFPKFINKLWVRVSDGPHPSSFKGKYFEGNLSHPNQLGHYKIKELIEDAFRQRT